MVDNARVIAATMATLAEFPDRELLGEDVIWCEDPALRRRDERRVSLLAPPRLHRHPHPPRRLRRADRAQRVAYRIIADCAIRDDQIYDEWLVRDQAAVVRQLGFDVVDWTRELIAREGGPEQCVRR